MTFRERLDAVLHGRSPDRIPFAPYDNLIHRGEFAREMRNRGMGLLCRRRLISESQPDVQVETRSEGDIRRTIYRTPHGSVSTARKTGLGRISDSGAVQTEWLIKSADDVDAVLFMLDNTRYHFSRGSYENLLRDLGNDGWVRGEGPQSPYEQTLRFFGLVNWSYALLDMPHQIERLMEALAQQQERRLPLLLESPAEFVACGSVNDSIGADRYREHVVPYYREALVRLGEGGKIGCTHAHNSNLKAYGDLFAQAGFPVVEAYTPPPISDLPIEEARRLWGRDTVIWVNFPETIFWFGADETRRYMLELLESDPNPDRLVIGMTEMGTYGIHDDESQEVFQAGVRAIVDAIDSFAGVAP